MFNPRSSSWLACTLLLSVTMLACGCGPAANPGTPANATNRPIVSTSESVISNAAPVAVPAAATVEKESKPAKPAKPAKVKATQVGAGDGDGGGGDKTASSGSNTNKKSFMSKIPLIGGGNAPSVVVKVPFQGKDIEVSVELKKDGVTSGIHEQAKAAVSDMQIEDYTNAVQELIIAVQEKPKNESYHFALGVAMEVTGNYAGARTNYAAANRLAGGPGSAPAQAALKRLEARTK